MNQKKHYIMKKLHTFNTLCSVSLYVIDIIMVISPQYMLWNFYWHRVYIFFGLHEVALSTVATRSTCLPTVAEVTKL